MTAIKTKFLPPTNNRPSRVKADAGCGRTAIVACHDPNTDMDSYTHAALAVCKKFEWTGTLIRGGWEDGSYIFVFLPKYWRISKVNGYAYDDDVIVLPEVKS